MSEPTSLSACVVADTIVRTVELGVTITDAAVDGDVTVVFCNLLDDGAGRCCPGCGVKGVYRDTVVRKLTDVPVVGHPLRLHVRVPRYCCITDDCARQVFAHNTSRFGSAAAVQTCVVHLIRNALRFVSYTDRKAVAGALKPVYTAPNAEAARIELDAFAASELGRKNPNVTRVFDRVWDQFIPFLAFPPEVRRVIYTTNSIESLNYQMRKVIKTRGQFPNDAAVVKLLWLAICNIEDRRAAERAKERSQKRRRTAPGRLMEGLVVTNWIKALEQLALVYPDRIEPYL